MKLPPEVELNRARADLKIKRIKAARLADQLDLARAELVWAEDAYRKANTEAATYRARLEVA